MEVLNRLINLTKYPVGVLFFLFLFELGRIFLDIALSILQNQDAYGHFFIGMGCYLLMWFVLFRNKLGRLFTTLEHEITHSIFALLTFHKIKEIRAHFHYGGYILFSGGKGNWLMLIAPYFFSTLGVIVIGLIHLSSPEYYPVLVVLLGYSFLHHIHNTIVAIHPRQTDLQQVGFFFSFLFLPGANLLMLIVLLTQIPEDQIHLHTAMGYLYDLSDYYLHQVQQLL